MYYNYPNYSTYIVMDNGSDYIALERISMYYNYDNYNTQ